MRRRTSAPLLTVLSAVVLLLAAVLAPAAGAQVASISVDASVDGPTSVRAGDTNVAGSVSVTNTSTGMGPVTFTLLGYYPECAQAPPDCAQAGQRAFALASTASGAAGTGCAGQTFTVTLFPDLGFYQFVPASPLVLAPPGSAAATCTINFTFDVLRVPIGDVMPGFPDGQTNRVVLADFTAQATSGGATHVGHLWASNLITVTRNQPVVVTQPSSSSIPAGSSIFDVATVNGLPFSVGIGGSVTFSLYGPNDATCTGTPVVLGPVAMTGDSATGGPFNPTVPGTYRFIARYSGDSNHEPAAGTCGDPSETFQVLPAGGYTPLTPARILDTRNGNGGLAGAIGPGETVSVQITGRGGVPATGVGAVAMNVTVTQPTAAGYLTLYPSGEQRPLAANLNFTPGKTVPNLVVVKVGAGGMVDMYNPAGSTHVIYDVAGWFSNDLAVGGRLGGIEKGRVLDTRLGIGGSSVRLGPGETLDLQLAGNGGVPASGAGSVVMNVAVTNTTAPSYLTVYPSGESRPLAANLTWLPGETASNRVIAKLGTNGRVTLYNPAGLTDIIIDTTGWFADGPALLGAPYASLTPARILDTRTGTGGIIGPIPAGGTVDVPIADQGGVPDLQFTFVVMNVTVVNPSGPGYLTFYRNGTSQPLVSDLNFAAGETRPNLVMVGVTGGIAKLYTSTTTHVVIDVAGYFGCGRASGHEHAGSELPAMSTPGASFRP